MKIREFKHQLITEVKRLIKEQAVPISRADLITKIKETDPRNSGKGEFFTVTFVKRTDGSTRTLNGRLGVRKYLKGGDLPYDAAAKELLPVFDAKANGYRMIDLRSILSAKVGGQEYIVR
jgi:hypothetical protein